MEEKRPVGIAQESGKRQNVNSWISGQGLSQIRERASREEVPYQLYDERDIRKTLGRIESTGKE